MADAIPDQNFPQPQKDYDGELQALRNRIQELEQRMVSREEIARIARSSIKIQSGQNCRVSGGNGEWTIDFQMPPATVVVTGVCVSTGFQISGTIQWG